jgi:signal peptidase I
VVQLDDGSGYALKRIVGLPGETVQLWRGYVFINCRLLREPYLPKYTYTFPDESREVARLTLDTDQYFLLGDNRTCSIDSRSYGPVCRKAVKSRVPAPPGGPRAYFADFTLPAPGKRTIRPRAMVN